MVKVPVDCVSIIMNCSHISVSKVGYHLSFEIESSTSAYSHTLILSNHPLCGETGIFPRHSARSRVQQTTRGSVNNEGNPMALKLENNSGQSRELIYHRITWHENRI